MQLNAGTEIGLFAKRSGSLFGRLNLWSVWFYTESDEPKTTESARVRRTACRMHCLGGVSDHPNHLTKGFLVRPSKYLPPVLVVLCIGVACAENHTRTAPADVKLSPLIEGLTKADTPAWLASQKCLLFTDLEKKTLYRLEPGSKPVPLREDAGRVKIGPDGRVYGIFGGKLASWLPGEEPQVIAAGKSDQELSLNDLAVAKGRLYFTTLKDPDKGRLSVVDLTTKVITVAYDGEDLPDLANPNGVAISPDGTALFVGVSNYKDRKKSGIYKFPIRPDGSLDVPAGKEAKWADVPAPDGLAFGPDGRLYATAGGVVVAVDDVGKRVAQIRIPKGSGTNLTFGGAEGSTLFVTTNNAVYASGVVKE